MSCSIIQGNEILCRDAVGGIKTLYLANWSNVQSYTASSCVISSITMVPGTKFYTFQLEKENATYENKQTGNLENGTTFFESTLTFTMKKLSASLKNSVKVLGQSPLMAIVLDNNGVYHVMGLTRAADCLEATMTTGKAMGDMSGVTMTITSKDVDFDYTYTGSISSITS